MLRIINKTLLIIILSLGLVTFNSATVLAEDQEQKYYIGLKTPYIWIDGDFDDLKESLGYGLIFGATKDIYSCEFSYSQSEHNILNFIPTSSIKIKALTVSVKITPSSLLNNQCQPYGLIGWGITQLSAEDSIDGKGFHLGFGMNCKLNKKIAFDGSVAYYRYNIESDDDITLINTIVSLGMKYYF